MLGKLAAPLIKVAVLLAENVLVPLATMASTSVIVGAILRKILGTSGVWVGKRINLVLLNKDMNVIRVIKSYNLGLLIDGVSEKKKDKKVDFLVCY